jgi:hypothetical protein
MAMSYETEDEMVHIKLFDGRPGSKVFSGVTPSEAVEHVCSEASIAWGCFLDPGQTAKICVRGSEVVRSFGNRHYITWPRQRDGLYSWAAKIGRPVGSMIGLQ